MIDSTTTVGVRNEKLIYSLGVPALYPPLSPAAETLLLCGHLQQQYKVGYDHTTGTVNDTAQILSK
jgi:hypothetical protein